MQFKKLYSIIVITVTVCIVFLGIPVQSDDNLDWFSLCGKIQNPDRAARIKLAKNLLEHWKVIDKSIPRLSPSEKEWLKKERKAGRFLSVYATAESSIDYIVPLSETIINTLTYLSKGQFKSKKNEVLAWASVFYIMGDVMHDFYRHYNKLVTQKKILYPPKRTMLSDNELPTTLYTHCAAKIFQQIILGFLMDKLPD